VEDRDRASSIKGILSLVVAYLPLAVGCLAAVFLPYLGLFIGVVLLFRRRNQGLAVIGLSLVVGILLLVGASDDDDKTSFPPGAARRTKALTRCLTAGPLSQDVEERMRICERKLNWEGSAP